VCSTDIGSSSHAHADHPGKRRAESPNDKGQGYKAKSTFVAHEQQDGNSQYKYSQNLVLSGKKSHGSLTDMVANLNHFFRTGTLRLNPNILYQRKHQGGNA